MQRARQRKSMTLGQQSFRTTILLWTVDLGAIDLVRWLPIEILFPTSQNHILHYTVSLSLSLSLSFSHLENPNSEPKSAMAASGILTSLSFPLNTKLLAPHPSSSSSSIYKITSQSGSREKWVCKMSVKAARFGSSSKGGAGLLERPTFDQSQFGPSTQLEEGGDMGRSKDKKGTGSGDSYRVLLINDTRHTENLVAKVLPQAVPSVTPDDARRLFHESQENGVAVVIVTVKEHAEFYAQMMVRGGLRSTIEPDSNIM